MHSLAGERHGPSHNRVLRNDVRIFVTCQCVYIVSEKKSALILLHSTYHTPALMPCSGTVWINMRNVIF